jgi:hypothetical protein
MKIVAAHSLTVFKSTTADAPPWKTRHIQSWDCPLTSGERAIKSSIEAYARLADAFNEEVTDDSGMGRDGYMGAHALAMLQAIRATLSMGFKTRFDGGAIDRLLRELATASGVNSDDV